VRPERRDLEMEEAAKDIEAQRKQDDQGNARSPQEHESEPLAVEKPVEREADLELQMDRPARLDESEPDTWNSLSSAPEAEPDHFDHEMDM
jgi:hypothetical protein